MGHITLLQIALGQFLCWVTLVHTTKALYKLLILFIYYQAHSLYSTLLSYAVSGAKLSCTFYYGEMVGFTNSTLQLSTITANSCLLVTLAILTDPNDLIICPTTYNSHRWGEWGCRARYSARQVCAKWILTGFCSKAHLTTLGVHFTQNDTHCETSLCAS